MRILKKILVWLVVVIAAISVLAQFLPAKWKVERTLVVQASPEAIYPFLADVQNWTQWNAFSTKDPNILHAYPSTTTGVGAMDVWKSKKFGDGSATLTKSEPGTGVWFDLRFDRMPNSVSPGSFVFTPAEGGTLITYTVEGTHGHNPMHRIFGLFMGKFLGPMFDESLANIKKLAETAPTGPEEPSSESTLDTAGSAAP